MSIKLLTFDFTGTLAYIRRPVGSIYADTANKYYLGGTGIVFQEHVVGKHFNDSYRFFDRKLPYFAYSNPKFNSTDWWYLVIERTFRLSGLTDARFVRSISNKLYTDFSTDKYWKLYPDVKRTLSTLRRKGLKLGVISNFDDRLPLIMDYLDIGNFDFVLCSGVIGREKPDPAIFKAALAIAEVGAEEAIHVGDSLDEDYHGAKEAGMKSFLINRKTEGSTSHKRVVARHTLTTLQDLIRVCE